MHYSSAWEFEMPNLEALLEEIDESGEMAFEDLVARLDKELQRGDGGASKADERSPQILTKRTHLGSD